VRFTRLWSVIIPFLSFTALAADPWADRVIAFNAGVGATPGYTNPAATLGSPERVTGESSGFSGSVTPFNTPFGTDEIVSIGSGGSLTLAFDEPVTNDPANPFGIDLLVFGNAFFFDAFFGPVANIIGDDGGAIEVSSDGMAWTLVTGTSADGLFPTLGYLDETNPFGGAAGLAPSDFTKPVDPNFNWVGSDLGQLITGYDGSGGGAGIDIGPLGFSSISFVRFSFAAGREANFEIDAVSDVSPIPSPGSSFALAMGSILTFRRARRGRWLAERVQPAMPKRIAGDLPSESTFFRGVLASGVLGVCTLGAAPAVAQPGWPMLAGNPGRTGASHSAIPTITAPTWIRASDEDGRLITFSAHACPVTDGDVVLAIGRVRPFGATVDSHRIFAFDVYSGLPRWHAVVQSPVSDSISTPLVDAQHSTAIHASGTVLAAFDLSNGATVWQRSFPRPIVNASPVATADRGPRDRVFITDYDGLGTLGSIYCINIDPCAAGNPYQPGEVVWSAPIGGSSGNSPAYLPAVDGGIGLVYVASVGDYPVVPGVVFAFDVESGAPVWQAENPSPDGFFGGVSVAPDVFGVPSVFAATYAFGGATDSARLVKFDAQSGEVLWSTSCNRTQAIPVVMPGGKILVSGGFHGYGTVPTLELFQDSGCTVDRVWHSALDTWTDLNGDGDIDPGEYLPVGGWIIQPLVSATGDGPAHALVGVLAPTGAFFAPANQLFTLNLARHPTDPSFIVGSHSGAGGSASLAGGLAFSIGVNGLHRFGFLPPLADVDLNGEVSIDDLSAWEQLLGRRDVDRNGLVTSADRAALIGAIRAADRAGWRAP